MPFFYAPSSSDRSCFVVVYSYEGVVVIRSGVRSVCRVIHREPTLGNLESRPRSLREAPGGPESRLMGRTLWSPWESPGATRVTLECSVRPRLRGRQHLKSLKDSHYMCGYAGRHREGSIACTASSRFVLASPDYMHGIYWYGYCAL